MLIHRSDRRGFLCQSASIAATAFFLAPKIVHAERSNSPTGKVRPVRLGGPVFANTSDPDQLALEHRKLGYSAAYCSNLPLNDSARLRAYSEAFARHDVVIAEVGRWVNLMESDPAKRKRNLETVTEGLALADAVGARCCVDIAGSLNPTSWFGPDARNFSAEFFDGAVENARKIIDAVKPKRSVFCYEMMGWAWPATADQYLRFIRAIDRKQFGVHLDPCNAINSPEKFYNNSALLNEAFDKLGKWVASCHAKDLTWDIEMNIHFREVVPGTGVLDYPTYLRRLSKLPQAPPLMLEHLANEQEYTRGREYILEIGRKADVAFA